MGIRLVRNAQPVSRWLKRTGVSYQLKALDCNGSPLETLGYKQPETPKFTVSPRVASSNLQRQQRKSMGVQLVAAPGNLFHSTEMDTSKGITDQETVHIRPSSMPFTLTI